MSRWLRFALLAICALPGPWASAHEMSIAEMELREMTPGQFVWLWTARNDQRGATDDLKPQWPEGCVTEENALHCGAGGLKGTLTIEGVGNRYSAAIVKIFWIDGQSSVFTLSEGQPKARLYGSAQDRRTWREIASTYTVLGIEHILSGFDHLLFVFSLLFLVGFQRKLIWTITAFTAAHSVTLALAALGVLTLRSPPVEASIALSIILVASEALHKRETLARRWPAVVAFLFGLVHGLGFAGALKEVGLPQNYLPTALLTFNVGVEIGQLMTVAAAWLLWSVLRRVPQTAYVRTPALYAIGAVAAYWSWMRIVAMFT